MVKVTVPKWNRCTIPPCIARALGKTWDVRLNRTRPFTDKELMTLTGWGKKRLRAVYRAATWQDVTCGEVDQFLWAVGISPSTQRRSVWMIERIRRAGDFRKLRHLRPGPDWLENLIKSLLRMIEAVGNESRNAD